MKQKRFGNSDIFISEISFGCGGYWGLPIFPEKKAEELIEIAVESGINFFDTGPNYSQGNAEKRMGKLLKKYENKVLYATKIGSYLSPSGKRVRDFSKKKIIESIDESLKNLKTDQLFLVQFHGPPKDVIFNQEIQDTLLELKTKEKIKHVGISGDGQIINDSINLDYIDCIMTTYNLITQSSLSNIKKAENAKKAILIKSPFSHMTFSNNIFKINSTSKLWYLLRIIKNYKKTWLNARKYKFINSIENWKNTEIALKFLLESPYVTSSVIGTTNPKHLKENIKTCLRDNLPDYIKNRL